MASDLRSRIDRYRGLICPDLCGIPDQQRMPRRCLKLVKPEGISRALDRHAHGRRQSRVELLDRIALVAKAELLDFSRRGVEHGDALLSGRKSTPTASSDGPPSRLVVVPPFQIDATTECRTPSHDITIGRLTPSCPFGGMPAANEIPRSRRRSSVGRPCKGKRFLTTRPDRLNLSNHMGDPGL